MKLKYFLNFLSLVAAGIIVTVAIMNLRINTQSKSSRTIVSYNREALASGGRPIGCYDEGVYEAGSWHYDCGPCERVEDSRGTGVKTNCPLP